MTEHGWELTKKMLYKRRWGRICLGILQTRDANGSSPWYATLEGIGADPETGKPPAMQISPDVPDVSAQIIALRWALPHLVAFAEHPAAAVRSVEEALAQYGSGELA